MTKGENVVLFIYDGGIWKGYACARNITFSAATDLIETSSSGTGKYATFLPTKNSFGATIDGIVSFSVLDHLTYPDLVQRELSHTLLLLRFQHTDDSTEVYTAECNMYITNSSDTAGYSDMNFFTIELKGTGVITQIFTAQPPVPEEGVQVERYPYSGVGGETGFTDAALIGKEILEVVKDGIGCSAILLSGTPIGKEVKYVSATGEFLFGIPFEPDEQAYILYQDINPES